MSPLSELEHWLQAEIVRPHEGGTRTLQQRETAVAPYVKPSRTLSAAERVEIYADMYFERLVEVLAGEYQAVAVLAGHDGFRRIVRGYLREHPSRHWSLNPLGRKLPEFLAGKFRTPRKAVIRDVATLENLMAIVFDAPRSRVLASDDVARVAPADFPAARLVCVPALELATFDHAANAIVRAARQGEPMPALIRKRTFTVVWRKEWVVWRMDLSEPMYHVLTSLKSGLPIGAAMAEGARHHHGDPQALQHEVSRSFGEWIGEGFFERIETA